MNIEDGLGMNLNTLNEMFPGDVASGIPFAQLSEFHSTTFCLQSHKGLIEALAAIPVGTDVNGIEEAQIR